MYENVVTEVSESKDPNSLSGKNLRLLVCFLISWDSALMLKISNMNVLVASDHLEEP